MAGDNINFAAAWKAIKEFSRFDVTKQEAHYILDVLMKVAKNTKYTYSWHDFFSKYDSGMLSDAIQKVRNDREYKNYKENYVEPQPLEADMDYVSRQNLVKDEVWFESKAKKIVIREETFRKLFRKK